MSNAAALRFNSGYGRIAKARGKPSAFFVFGQVTRRLLKIPARSSTFAVTRSRRQLEQERSSKVFAMTWLIRIAILTLVGHLAAPATAQAPTYYGLRFPDTVAGFPLSDVQDFEKVVPGLGYAGRYTANGWFINVFIYDDKIKDIPDDLSADIVTAQFAKSRVDVYERMAMENGKANDTAGFEIAGPDKRTRFFCRAYLLDKDSEKADSFMCLTTWHGKFVKFRLGTPSASGTTEVAKRFVAAWAPILWP